MPDTPTPPTSDRPFSALPERWLFVNEDVITPLQEARETIIAAVDLLGLIETASDATQERFSLMPETWTFLTSALWNAHDRVDKATKHIETTAADAAVLLPDNRWNAISDVIALARTRPELGADDK